MRKENRIQAHQRLSPYIHNTAVLQSRLINKIVGAQLYFKCENFQKVGVFKMRGLPMQLYDTILQNPSHEKTFPFSIQINHCT